MKPEHDRGGRSPYGIKPVESCTVCQSGRDAGFCHLPAKSLKALDAIKHTSIYPKGAVLCVEGEAPRGVFIICSGHVKLSTMSMAGRVLITRVAEAREVLGLSAAVSSRPYEVTAETLEPCQISFVGRAEFLRFLAGDGAACLRTAMHLSNNYHTACEQIRLLGLSPSSASRLARLILEWCRNYGTETGRGTRLHLTLTHEEIAHLIGVSRETASRTFSEFRQEKMIELRGATLRVLDKERLAALAYS
jgi:CRP/FNR family transcriptional regulator, cyclic AMP receptor protein